MLGKYMQHLVVTTGQKITLQIKVVKGGAGYTRFKRLPHAPIIKMVYNEAACIDETAAEN